ncbi:hypothetical protein [Ascidiimonas sp. W6]|uniref:hypothetical protein n=1 Tax=Ascidiimonas meishanensis TaxID=3128903 RepID=UPI0030EEFAFA
MSKILILDNFYPLQTRTSRIKHTLLPFDFEVDATLWNRNGLKIKEDETHFVYNKSANTKTKKIAGLLGYTYFIAEILKKQKYDVIIASHWDMLLIGALLKSKNQVLIYENLDMPTHSNTSIRKIFWGIEKLALKRTNGILFASRFFQKFYSKKIPSMLLENRPSVEILKGYTQKPIGDKLSIIFLGNIRYVDILKNLIKAVWENPKVSLVIKGSGLFTQEIIRFMKNHKGTHENVKLDIGWYDYHKIGEYYTNFDMIWAAYPNKDFNVKHAISNKYFESLLFEKPGIFAEKTDLGDYVVTENIGFVVDPYSTIKIKTLLDTLCADHYKLVKEVKQKQAKIPKTEMFWEQEAVALKVFLKEVIKANQ